jgi:hypothetical protein
LTYKFNESNQDFTRFLFHVSLSGALTEAASAFASADDQGHQQILDEINEYTGNERTYGNTEMTEDASQVFFVGTHSAQLEDLTGGASEVVSIMPDGLPSECGLRGPSSFTGFGSDNPAAASQWRSGYHRIDKVTAHASTSRPCQMAHPATATWASTTATALPGKPWRSMQGLVLSPNRR